MGLSKIEIEKHIVEHEIIRANIISSFGLQNHPHQDVTLNASPSWLNVDAREDLSVGGDLLFIDASENKGVFGFGNTTVYNQPFSFNGGIGVGTTTTGCIFKDGGGGVFQFLVADINSVGFNDLWVRFHSTGSIYCKASDGNVGISTSTPATELDVNGETTSLTYDMPTTVDASTGVFKINNVRVMHNFGTDDFFLGNNSGNFTHTGNKNTGCGDDTCTSLTSALRNTGVGYNALNACTTGDDNTAIGEGALEDMTTGSDTTAIGRKAASSLTGSSTSNSVVIGNDSAKTSTNATENVIIGSRSAETASTIGADNVIIGFRAGSDAAALAGDNIFIGANAGRYETDNRRLIIDFFDRTDEATGRTDGIITGVMSNTVANQSLNINAVLNATQEVNITGDLDARGSAIFNEDGADKDFRIEGTGKAFAFFVDGTNGNVGIGGISTPAQALELGGNFLMPNNNEIRWKDSGGTERTMLELTSADDMYIGGSFAGSLIFVGGGSYTERFRITDNGNLAIGSSSADSLVHITDTNSTTDTLRVSNIQNSTEGVAMHFEAIKTGVAETEANLRSTCWLRSWFTNVGNDNVMVAFQGYNAAGIAVEDKVRFEFDDGSKIAINAESGTGSIVWDDSNGPREGHIELTDGSGILRFGSGGSDRMKLDASNGYTEFLEDNVYLNAVDLGINTATPNADLDNLGTTRLGDSTTNYLEVSAAGLTDFVGTTAGLPYAQIYEEDGSSTLAIPAQDTFVQVTAFSVNGESNDAVPDHTNDHITIGKAGRYLVTANIAFSQTTAVSIEYDFHIQTNNGANDFPCVSAHRDTAGASTVGNCSCTGIIDVANGDTVELWVERLTGGAVTRTITIPQCSITVTQIGGT